MTPVTHGVKLSDTDGANRLLFGWVRLLGSIFIDQLFLPTNERHHWPFRTIGRRFLHIGGAADRLAWKIDRVSGMYHRAATSYAHAMINRELSSGDDELEIHLDSILVYLRVFADTIAAAIPYLYEPSRDNMPFRSFREQTKWFVNVRPDYDPDYTAILLSELEWFELLAGKRGRGVRDLLIHHFAHIQALVTVDPPDVRGQITASMISEHGYVHNDLPALLTTIVDGLFQFLDALVSHHIQRIVARTEWMALPLGEPYAGEFYRFDVSPASHWLYPIRSGFTERPIVIDA